MYNFFHSYHILTSHVIYYWTDAQQHEIYLLYRQWKIIIDFLSAFYKYIELTGARSITQQQNDFLLCSGKLRENNINKQSSKNSNQVCFDSIKWLINKPFNL